MAAGKLVLSARSPGQSGFYKRGYRKRYVRKFKRKHRALLYKTPQLGGIIQRQRCRLMWYNDSDLLSLDNVNDHKKWDFKLNSLYDPDDSPTTSIQPVGRDRLADLYSLYLVRNVKVIFDVSVDSITGTAGGSSVIFPLSQIQVSWISYVGDGISSTPKSLTHLEGLPNSKLICMSPGTTRRLTKTVNINKLTGCYGSPFNNGFGGNIGSDPGRTAWGFFEVRGPGSDATYQCKYRVRMRLLMDVEFAQPKISAYNTA